MTLDRRTLLAGAGGIAALAGTAALAGCAANPPGTVRYWGISGDNSVVEDEVLKAFARTDAGSRVRIAKSTVPSNGTGDATSLITAVRGGNAPDVWYMDRFSAVQYAAIGLLEPIDGMLERFGSSADEVRSEFKEFAVDELSFDGRLYGLPFGTDDRGLYYNVDLMREAGVDLDELDPANGPLTIDRVTEISDSLIRKDSRGNYTRLGFIPWDGEGWGYTWSLGKGATYFDESDCSIDLTASPIVDAFDFLYREARRLDYAKVDAFKATYEPPNHPPAQTSFFSGKQGFMLSGSTFQYSMRKYVPKLRFGVTQIPVFRAGDRPFTWSGGYALVCPKGSSLSREVYEFMRYYTGPAGQRIYMPKVYSLPTNNEVIADPRSRVFTTDLKLFVEQLEFTTSRPPFPVSQLWWDSMSQAQQSVQLGSRTAREAMEIAQARVAPQMKLYCPFRMPSGYGRHSA